MTSRRTFLKGSLIAAAGLAVSRAGRALAGGGLPSGVVYTAKNPGKWSAKVGSHAPKVTVTGNKVAIETKHPMTEKHYIVRHTLVAADGKVLGAKTFYPTDKKAVSSFDLPSGAGSKFYATSFCNLHDFWLTEFSV